jgi:hypothetical protein
MAEHAEARQTDGSGPQALFEWRAALGPWRGLILGALGVGASGCDSLSDWANASGSSNHLGGSGGLPSDAYAGRVLDGGVIASVASSCVGESHIGGNWYRCSNGMLHRTEPGTCRSRLPRRGFSVDGVYESQPAGCHRDTDCSGPHAFCGGDDGAPQCVLGCVTDADCGAGQVCACGPDIGECRPASCSTDADCADGALCGSYEDNPFCGSVAFACQTPRDQCSGDLDCDFGGACTIEYSYRTTDASTERFPADHRSCAATLCFVGRPFLIAGHPRLAPSAVRGDWYRERVDDRAPAAAADPALRAAVARGWLDQGLMEHASVAAFARFTLQLLSLGAPAGLVAASASAMGDEIRHARDCFALARRHLDHDVGPASLPLSGALDAMDLSAIVLGTLREGCIGETVAAAEAAEALQHCQDPAARAVLSRIAVEEGRHAELAWRFVAWALQVGPPSLLDQVRDAFATELTAPNAARAVELPSPDRELARHGLLTVPLRAALRERVLSAIVSPCAEVLLAQAGAVPAVCARADAASPVC